MALDSVVFTKVQITTVLPAAVYICKPVSVFFYSIIELTNEDLFFFFKKNRWPRTNLSGPLLIAF